MGPLPLSLGLPAAMAALSLEECVKMEDGLIKGYLTEEFQTKIWEAWRGKGDDQVEMAKARQAACLEVQGPVIQQFGFESSRAGVMESVKAFTPEMNNDPEIAWRNGIMAYLVDPGMQQKVASGRQPPPVGILPSRKARPDPAEWPEGIPGHVWHVVGGGDKGGIIVRSGKDTKSSQLDKRLSTGAIIEEMDRDEDRIKYEKIKGDGPDMGWVSMTFKTTVLVEPLWFDLEEDIKIKDTYKVVHDRVAMRIKPNKDSKMVSAETKGSKVRGTVIEQDGVQWLRVKVYNNTEAEEAYMMIDGASVGLGVLLQKV